MQKWLQWGSICGFVTPSKYSLASWEIPITGKIICKRRNFQHTMFDYQRVTSSIYHDISTKNHIKGGYKLLHIIYLQNSTDKYLIKWWYHIYHKPQVQSQLLPAWQRHSSHPRPGPFEVPTVPLESFGTKVNSWPSKMPSSCAGSSQNAVCKRNKWLKPRIYI